MDNRKDFIHIEIHHNSYFANQKYVSVAYHNRVYIDDYNLIYRACHNFHHFQYSFYFWMQNL